MNNTDIFPLFTQEERDRRWNRVRRAMEEQGVDAIIGVPNMGHWDQFQADTRYLTQIGGNQTEAAVVFPGVGEVTAVVRGDNEVEWWGMMHRWIADIRPSNRSWSGPVAVRLRELGLDRARIGVIGLSGLVRAPEGTVPWSLFESLREALPAVEWINATPLMHEVRAVKSVEEIAFIRRAEALAEEAAQTMLNLARPGVPESVVYAAMMQTMIAAGGDVTTMILWGAGAEPPWGHRMITRRLLQLGDYLNNEIEAKWGGYIAQVVAPAVLGKVPAIYAEMYAATRSAFEDLCRFMQPGTPFRAIQERYARFVRQAGYEPGAALMHGRGLGEDYPLVWGQGDRTMDGEIEVGNVFILKPAAFLPGSQSQIRVGDTIVECAFRAGDTVVVTEAGAHRLGSRPLQIVEIAGD